MRVKRESVTSPAHEWREELLADTAQDSGECVEEERRQGHCVDGMCVGECVIASDKCWKELMEW